MLLCFVWLTNNFIYYMTTGELNEKVIQQNLSCKVYFVYIIIMLYFIPKSYLGCALCKRIIYIYIYLYIDMSGYVLHLLLLCYVTLYNVDVFFHNITNINLSLHYKVTLQQDVSELLTTKE